MACVRHNPGTGCWLWSAAGGASGPRVGRRQLTCSSHRPPAGPFPVLFTRGRLMSAPTGAQVSVAGTEAQHTPGLPRTEGTARARL